METLLKILQEKMLLIEQLESQLIEQTKKAEESTKTMLYWYEKQTKASSEALTTTENGN